MAGGQEKQHWRMRPRDAGRVGSRRPTDPGAPSYREIVKPTVSRPQDKNGVPADQREVVLESKLADPADRREVVEPESLPKNSSDDPESEEVPQDKREVLEPESSIKNTSGDPESEAVSAGKRELVEPASSTKNTSDGDPESETIHIDKREVVESESRPGSYTSGVPESEAVSADKREVVEPERSQKNTSGDPESEAVPANKGEEVEPEIPQKITGCICESQEVPSDKPISSWDEKFYALIYSGRNWLSPYTKNLYFPGSVPPEQIRLPETEMADTQQSFTLFSAPLECWNGNICMPLNSEQQSTAASSSVADDHDRTSSDPTTVYESFTSISSADSFSHMDQLFGDNPFTKQS